MMLVYTSITKNYLPKARVLAISIKKFHPDWHFVLLLSDSLPEDFNLDNEPFDEILLANELNIPNFKSWAFCHSIVELCTAVKGPAACLLAKRKNVTKIMYLDPDIKVFNSLVCLDKKLDTYDILLTPHLLDLETDDLSIKDNEISALKHGAYNLGFFAVKTSGQGLQFINWWSERLIKFCYDDIPAGLFTDQRWCDLAPAFFSNLGIVRDRGCNVATWNIAHRHLSKDDNGVFYVNGAPLRFYHFTSYDNGDGMIMLKRYASNQSIAHELWDTYRKDLFANGQKEAKYRSCYYDQFENGESIPSDARRVYKARPDLQKHFPSPYSLVEPSFLNWWNVEIAQNKSTVCNFANIKKRTLISLLIQGVRSPRQGFRLAKSSLQVMRLEGFFGLIRRIRYYK